MRRSPFQKFDAGEGKRSPRSKNQDCQVRALTTALGIDYFDAWKLLYAMQGERRACGFTLVEELRDFDARLQVVRQLDFPAKRGTSRMTGKDFCEKYKRGRFILRMANHVVAVKDGILYDTWNCLGRCVYTAWEVVDRPAKATEVGK